MGGRAGARREHQGGRRAGTGGGTAVVSNRRPASRRRGGDEMADERKDHLWKVAQEAEERVNELGNETQPIGLDVGTSKVVTARRKGKADSIDTGSQLNAFIPVPFSKFTQRTLDQNGISYFHEGDELVIYGNATE